MLEVNFNPFPVLYTDRLILRRFTHDDTNELFLLRSNEDVMRYVNRLRPKSNEDITQLIDKMTGMVDNNDGIPWAVTLKNETKLIGHVSFHVLKKEHFRAEVGYMLHPDFFRKGIMSEALRAVLDYGFKTMGLHSVEAIVNPENIASINLLERNNFIREAYFKEDFYWQGKFLDSAIYSLIAPF